MKKVLGNLNIVFITDEQQFFFAGGLGLQDTVIIIFRYILL